MSQHDEDIQQESVTGIFSETPTQNPSDAVSGNMHIVQVHEVLSTEKYVYLEVTEGHRSFWIATGKRPVEKGRAYIYREGLLKTNFVSKEHGRVFDTVYLVSSIVEADHGQDHGAETSVVVAGEENDTENQAVSIKHDKGVTKIAELVDNPNKFANKTITISGKCVKMNPNIMGRNWIHLKDGTRDDYDLVVTSDIGIPEGHVVTLTGTVTLDKDFGAGYRYDIIVENGTLVR